MPAIDHRTLRDRRDELDLSNGQLAEQVDAKEGYIVNIMCGSARPSRRMIYRLSRALDLPVEQIELPDRTPQGDPSEPPNQPPNQPTRPPRRRKNEKETGPRRVDDRAAS